MMNIGNKLRKIGTVEVGGSISIVPAIKIQRVTVTAVTFIIIIWDTITHIFKHTIVSSWKYDL